MNFVVHIAARAQRGLRSIPAADARRITAAFESMGTDPLGGDVVKLKGTDALRRRVGDYRIIFTIDFKRRAVIVFDVLRRTSTTYR